MHILSLTGFNLLYVGTVLFINGLWLLDKVERKEIIFINSFVGLLSFIVAVYLIFSPEATPHTVRAGAFTFLFSCTYLWVAFNQYSTSDGRGLGWYCLFVALTAVPITLNAFKGGRSLGELWLAYCWASWVILWFIYFLNLVFSKIKKETVGWITILIGIMSAWVPGYLLLNETLK